MKILLADNWPIVNAKGGTEAVLCHMANAMVERGHEVLILHDEKAQGKPFFPLAEAVRVVNAYRKEYHVRVTLQNLCTFWDKEKCAARRYAFKDASCQRRYQAVYDRFRPDVVVCYTSDMCHYFREMMHVPVPVVLMFHFNAETILANPKSLTSIENAECLQVLMPHDLTVVRQKLPNFKHKLVLIGNVVPQYATTADYAAHKIIHVGRVHCQQKRQAYLIEAFAKLKDQYPDWVLEFWGETDVDTGYYNKLLKLVQKYELQGRIKFCGTTNNIADKLQQASIFAFPSAFEGFSLAMTEAMSMGLPVVAFDNIPGIAGMVIHNENGLLAEAGVDAFAYCLAQLMESEELRRQLGTQGRLAMQQYQADAIWQQWEQLLRELCQAKYRN